MAKYTDARERANRKWDAANLDRLSLALPKGQKGMIKAHADARGESVNGYIGRVLADAMARDAVQPELAPASPGGDGGIILPPETLAAAQQAAQEAGESLQQYLTRAILTQAQRDIVARRLD